MIPDDVLPRLLALGLGEADAYTRRDGFARVHPPCGLITLAVLDRNGLLLLTDPQPVDPDTEAMLILTGRRTANLYLRQDRWQVDIRSIFDIRAPRRADADVVKLHVCGDVQPRAVDTRVYWQVWAGVGPLPNDCPF